MENFVLIEWSWWSQLKNDDDGDRTVLFFQIKANVRCPIFNILHHKCWLKKKIFNAVYKKKSFFFASKSDNFNVFNAM